MTAFFRFRALALVFIAALACVFSASPGRAEGLKADVKISDLSPMETRGYIDGKHQKLSFSDLASGSGDEVWAATDRGVFRKDGIAWEYVPSRATDGYAYPQTQPFISFERAFKVAVADDGTPWVIAEIPDLHPERVGQNRTERGLLYHTEMGWVRATGRVLDVATGGGRIWALSERDIQGPGSGHVLMRGTTDAFDSLFAIPEAFGPPIAIDVSEDGTVFIGTENGSIYSLNKGSDGKNECNDLDVKCGWTLETLCDETDGPIVCRATDRTLTGLAVGNGSLVLAGTVGDSPSVLHYSYNRFSGTEPFVRLAGQMNAIALDKKGNLLGINASGAPVYGEISYDYTGGGDVLGAVLDQALSRPILGKLMKFVEGSRPLSLRVPNDPVFRDGFNPTFGTSIGFVIYPLEDGASVTGEDQCVLSYGVGSAETFSICLDGSHEKMTVRIGGSEKEFDVNIPGQKFFGDQGPIPVGRHFLLRAENGEAILSAVDEVTNEFGLPIKDGMKAIEVGRFFYGPVESIDSVGAKLHIGSRDGRTDNYRGYVGNVRIWNTADLTPLAVFTFHYTNGFADNYMPGLPDLLLDAPFFQDGKRSQTAFKFRKSVPLEGLWSCATCTGDYDIADFSLPGDGDPIGFGFKRMEVLRIQNVVLGEMDIAAPKLEIFRDGEGGVQRTTFEMSEEGTYLGWQDPRTGELAMTVYTSVFKSEPFVLNVLDEDSFEVVPPFDPTRAKVYRRISPEPEIRGKGENNDLGNPVGPFRGYNILTMSPYITDDTLNGGNAHGDRGVPATRESDGLIFEAARFDAQGNEIVNPMKVPWGVLFIAKDKGGSSNRVRTVETTRQLQQDLRAGIGLGAEVPEVAKFSASADLQKSVEEMVQKRSMTAVGDIWWAVHGLIFDPARAHLTENFSTAVKRARDALGTKTEQQTVRAILNEFGTHYANGVVYGCHARFEKILQANILSLAAEHQWNVQTENEGLVAPTLKLSVDANFGMGEKIVFGETGEEVDTRVYSAGGTVAFDSEEATCGEEVGRSVPIAYDLRPITQVLSPILFEDADIYTKLRARMEVEIAALLREEGVWNNVSDVIHKPEMYLVTLDSIQPRELGSTNAVAGKIALEELDGSKELWSAKSDNPLSPSSLEGDKVTIGQSRVVTVLPTASGTSKVTLVATLDAPQSAAVLPEVRKSISVAFAADVDSYSDTVTAMSADCLCMTACPAGFKDENGKCIKSCPAEFKERGETMCYGSYSAQAYPVWESDECAEDVSRNSKLSGACRHEGLAVYLPCKEGYKSVPPFGTCMPDCSEFGLDDYEPIGGLKLGNMTCMRPTTSRQTTEPSAQSSCAPGSVPTEFCSMVDINYSVARVTLTP